MTHILAIDFTVKEWMLVEATAAQIKEGWVERHTDLWENPPRKMESDECWRNIRERRTQSCGGFALSPAKLTPTATWHLKMGKARYFCLLRDE